jgi:acetyl esterase/lipase
MAYRTGRTPRSAIAAMAALCVMTIVGVCFAADAPKPEPLWPVDSPEMKNVKEADRPSLTVYLPPKDKAVGTAVVICPGGGYGFLAIDHEGHHVARWFNDHGVAGIVLKYRHRGNGFGHPAPLNDAQRAISTVRSRAAEYGIDPSRIGVMGFSAGGHLASTVGTHYHKGNPAAADSVDRASCRPDFMILVYPVISLIEPYAHAGSRDNLLGKGADRKLVEDLSNERQVTADTPPTFLLTTNQDDAVPAENSIYFALALRKAKVPVELHMFELGGHGFGLGGSRVSAGASKWPDLLADWLKARKLLDKPKGKE